MIDKTSSGETPSPSPKRVATKGNGRLPAPAGKDGMTPAFIIHALRRWWKIAAPLGILLAAATAATVFLLFEKSYLAVGNLHIRTQQPYIAYPTAIDKQQSQRFIETQLQLFRLQVVLDPVVLDATRLKHPEILAEPDPIDYLRRKVKVTMVGQSDICRIEYEAPEATRAKQVVDALIRSYIAYVTGDEAEYRTTLNRLLDKEITRRKEAGHVLWEQLKNLSEQNGLTPSPTIAMFAGRGMASAPGAELRSLLVETEAEIVLLGIQVALAKDHVDQSAEPVETDIDAAVAEKLATHKQDIEKRRQQIQAMEVAANQPTSPLLQQYRASLEAAEQTYANLEASTRTQARIEMGRAASRDRGALLEELQWKLKAAETSREALTKRLADVESKAPTSISGQLEVDFKYRELMQAEGVLDVLVQQQSKLITEERAPSRVEWLDNPTLAEGPNFGTPVPRQAVTQIPLKEMLLGVLISLCIPCGFAVGWEWAVKRVNNADEIRQQIGVKILGEITALPTFSYGQSASKRTLARRHLFEESVDGLRTTLVLTEPSGQNRVLAITSAVSSEGKTSVAAHLAMSLARATGERILLIDGDMRAPDIHRMFDLSLNPGLADVLTGEATLAEALTDSGFPQLDVLPAGLLSTNPHRLLHNGEFRSLLEDLRDSYAYIILDTPPVLGACESLVLARHADATVICAMRDRTRMSHIEDTHSRLEGAGATTIGVVMSGLPIRQFASRYGSYSYTRASAD